MSVGAPSPAGKGKTRDPGTSTDSLIIVLGELKYNLERYHRDDGCVGILRGRLMWWFQDEEDVRCVATGFRVLNISLLDREQT